MRKISLVIAKNFMLVQTRIHRLFGGSYNMPLKDKIAIAASTQNYNEMIYHWDEV